MEFWDGVTETAWKVCEPTSIQHEEPSRLLGQMAGRFAMMRGSRIASFGSADLVRRDAVGRKRWLMQADEVLYLHPDRVRLQGPAIDVDADPLPDVVLEVDHTTDVRRRKLGIYKESGFAEIWVLVPWEASVRAPGLAILVRWGAEYREEGESRVFPGWKAQEIHLALTEAPMSEPAWRALGRTALAMGAREGTTPQHDPLMASESKGAGKKSGPGPHGSRGGDAPGKGHRSVLADPGRPEALRRAPDRSADGGGAGVCGRGRFPAAHPRAAQPHGDLAPRRNGEDGFSAHPPHRVVAVATQRRGAASGVHRGGRLPAAGSIVTVRH